MLWLWTTFLLEAITILKASAIQNFRINRHTRFEPYNHQPQPYENSEAQYVTRNFRHIGNTGGWNFDWENGLREATTQALIKEGSRDVNLRKHIFGAPILSKEVKATPFGDIAVLARGQLYLTPGGYLFNQDPYQNDCEGCHNEYSRNEIWRPKNHEQLVALWTVRRIRHRSVREEILPRFEVEFTISPVTPYHRTHGQITEEGQFNYAIPGHVFLMKGGDASQNLENHRIFGDQRNHLNAGHQLIAQSADGHKYILQSFPGVLPHRPQPQTQPPQYLTSNKPVAATTQTTTTQLLTDETLSEDEEKKIYQTLLSLLHKKTTSTTQQTSPPISATSASTSTQLSESTLVQLPDGNLVPITKLSSPFITKTTPGFVTVRFPDSTSSQNGHIKETTKISMPQPMYTKPMYTKPIIGYREPTEPYRAQTPITQYTQPQTSRPPPKTTFHFFSAAEDNDDVLKPTSGKPTSQYSTPQFTGPNNFLRDTTLSQTQDTVTTIKQKTTSQSPPTVLVQPTQEQTRVPELVTAPFRPSTQKQSTQANKFQFVTTAVSRLSTKIATQKPVKTTIINKPLQTHSDAETQFSTIKPVATSQNTVYSSVKYPIQTKPFQAITTTITSQKPLSITELKTSRIPTTVFIEPSTENVVMSAKETSETSTKITSEPSTELSPKTSPFTQTSTTFKPPTDNLVETTLGVTKIMSTITDDRPATIYIVSEPVEERYTTSFDRGKKTTVQTAETSLSASQESSTPQHIITTIGADGTVSVKTTPIETIASKKPTRKHRTKQTTEKSNFLIEDLGASKTPLYKYPSKDYSANDIFGTTPPSVTASSASKKVTKPYKVSDVELALFGKERHTRNFRNRKLKYLGKHTTSNSTEKAKYSSSYTTTDKNLEANADTQEDQKTTTTSTTAPPNTSQSVLTSISYKINRRKNRIVKNSKENIETTTQNVLTTTNIPENIITANVVEIENNNIHNFKDSDVNLDEFASKLFSEAKGIEYLDHTTITATTTTLKTPKYMRRRSYVARSRKPIRKKKISGKPI